MTSVGEAAAALDRVHDETPLEYRRAAAALGGAQARLSAAVREVAAFRRASAEYAASARRLQGAMLDVLDAHDVGSALGPQTSADVAAAQGALVELVEGSVSSYLDRFMTGLQHHIKPGYDAAALHQERMLEALAARQAHGEAADALGSTLVGKPEPLYRALLASVAHREASALFALGSTDAVTTFARCMAQSRSALIDGLADVMTAQADDVAQLATRLRAAAGGTLSVAEAEAAETRRTGGVVDAAATALLWEGALGGGSRGGLGHSVGVGLSNSRSGGGGGGYQLLVGEELQLQPISGVRNEGARGGAGEMTGTLIVTNYCVRWVFAPTSPLTPHTPPPVFVVSTPRSSAASEVFGDGLDSSRISVGDIASVTEGDDGCEGEGEPPLEAFDQTADLVVAPPHLPAAPALAYRRSTRCVTIPIAAIARLEVVGGLPPSSLLLISSDMRTACFTFTSASASSSAASLADSVLTTLKGIAWARVPRFPLVYRFASSSNDPSVDGWALHANVLTSEFARLSALWPEERPWYRVSQANTGFTLCSTYPEALLVPATLSDAQLLSASKYRSKARLPAVCWFSGSICLARASQPRSGVFSARSSEDEKLVASLQADAAHVVLVATQQNGSAAAAASINPAAAPTPAPARSGSSAPPRVLLAIMDARPRLNALANSAAGGGAENVSNYKGCTLTYLDIDNIHVVRDAFVGLRSALLRDSRRVIERRLGTLAVLAAVSGGSDSPVPFSSRVSALLSDLDTDDVATASHSELLEAGRIIPSSLSVRVGSPVHGGGRDQVLASTVRGAEQGRPSSWPGSPPGGVARLTSPRLSTPSPSMRGHPVAPPDTVASSFEEYGGGGGGGDMTPLALHSGGGGSESMMGGHFPPPVPGTPPSYAVSPPPSRGVGSVRSSSLPHATTTRASVAINAAPVRVPLDWGAPSIARDLVYGGVAEGSSSSSFYASGAEALGGEAGAASVIVKKKRSALRRLFKATKRFLLNRGASSSSSGGSVDVPQAPDVSRSLVSESGVGSGEGTPTFAFMRGGGGGVVGVVGAGAGGALSSGRRMPRSASVSEELFDAAMGMRSGGSSGGGGGAMSGGVGESGKGVKGGALSPGRGGEGRGRSSSQAPPSSSSEWGIERGSSSSSGRLGLPSGDRGFTGITVGYGGGGTGGRDKRSQQQSLLAQPPLAWMRLLSILLEGSVRVSARLLEGISVLIHCSDGWDRTSSLTSLALLQVDPRFRSLEGLCALIAKEWCSFGHRFGRRCGTGTDGFDRSDAGDGQRAPIFAQFVDAVWQLARQFPTAFEFNDRALIALVDHAYSGRFGTFVGDCEKERHSLGLPASSPSLWSYMLHPAHRVRFTNEHYVQAHPPPPVGGGPRLPSRAVALIPVTAPEGLAVWPLWAARFT